MQVDDPMSVCKQQAHMRQLTMQAASTGHDTAAVS
jgi:hypothetical protein